MHRILLAVLIYPTAMIAANLSIAAFGPWVSPINSFFLIGLDLTLRDYLHVHINRWQMAGLIVGAGLLSYMLNPAAGQIAVASAVAFIIAGCVDYLVFSMSKGSWLKRCNKSNVAGALTDSVLFPTLAFGVFMPEIIALQATAKIIGGALWAIPMARFRKCS